MDLNDDTESFYKNIITAMDKAETDSVFAGNFYNAFNSGNRNLYQKQEVESHKFDDVWINTIESYFPSINRITINLKSNIRYQREILPVEKAKKISKESVIYLTSHTNDIQDIKNGDVLPKRVLTSLSETEYGIYENRFIMTLIYRLKDYIGRRVKIMENELMAKKSTHLSIENNFKYRNADYIINVDVKRSEEVVERKIDENNQNVLEKARKIYKLILHLCNGQFMQILKKFKTVSSPIMKTQVILKNPDFKNAYYLWLYLDKNSDLEFSSCIDTVNKRFTPIYKKQLDQVNLMLFSTLMLNSGFETDSEEVKTKEKKAQILTKLPGEIETDPVSYKVEDNTINEFYLNRSKQILKKQFDSYLEETSDYKLSLKKALESTMAITNSLYESFFSINADEDIFSRLIKEEDPADEMKDAYEKYNIANLVRSVKEKDYLNSLELENKWQDEIKVKNKKYLKYLKAESDKELSEELKKNQEKYNKKLSLINNNQKTEKRKYLKQQNKKVQETNEKISEEFKEYKKQIKLKQKEKLAAEKVKQRKLFEQKKLTAVNQLASDKQNIKAVLKTKSHKKQEEINVKKQLLKEQSEQEIMLKTENLLKNEDLLKIKNNTDHKETTAAILPKTENNSNVEAFFKTDGLSDSKIS